MIYLLKSLENSGIFFLNFSFKSNNISIFQFDYIFLLIKYKNKFVQNNYLSDSLFLINDNIKIYKNLKIKKCLLVLKATERLFRYSLLEIDLDVRRVHLAASFRLNVQ